MIENRAPFFESFANPRPLNDKDKVALSKATDLANEVLDRLGLASINPGGGSGADSAAGSDIRRKPKTVEPSPLSSALPSTLYQNDELQV